MLGDLIADCPLSWRHNEKKTGRGIRKTWNDVEDPGAEIRLTLLNLAGWWRASPPVDILYIWLLLSITTGSLPRWGPHIVHFQRIFHGFKLGGASPLWDQVWNIPGPVAERDFEEYPLEMDYSEAREVSGRISYSLVFEVIRGRV